MVVVYALCTTAGCDGSGDDPDRDGGGTADGASPGAATLRVELRVDDERTAEDPTVTAASIGVAELHVPNDRGGDLEPRVEAVGSLRLLEEPTVDLGAVTPATYGRLIVGLSAGDWGPAFDLSLARGSESLHVVGREDVTIDVRCDMPVLIPPGGSGELLLALDASAIWAALPVPPEPGESVEVDAERAPEVLAAIEDALAVAWALGCELELDSEGASAEPPEGGEPDH